MKNSTAQKLKQVPAGYLIMGIDPHKKKHAAVAMTQDAVVHTKFKITNSRQAPDLIRGKATRSYWSKPERRGLEPVVEALSSP